MTTAIAGSIAARPGNLVPGSFPPAVAQPSSASYITVLAVKGQVATIPPSYVQTTTEDITWGLDVTPHLAGAQTVTVASAALFDTTTQTAVALSDSAGVTGNVIAQRVRAGALTANHVYRLTVTFTPSGTTNVIVSALGLACPF